MTLDQYIAVAASGGSSLAALATLLTVWQIAKQRQATYRPDIVVKQLPVYAGTETPTATGQASHDEALESLLTWKSSADGDEEEYELLLANIGLGAATDISVTWDFPMVTFVSAMSMYAAEREWEQQITYERGMLSLPNRASMWRNQQRDHLDYVLPASIEKEPTKLWLPSAYVWAVATRMSLFLRDTGQQRGAPDIPPLRLTLSFNDIAGKRHYQAYDLELRWSVASARYFRATLIPKKV